MSIIIPKDVFWCSQYGDEATTAQLVTIHNVWKERNVFKSRWPPPKAWRFHRNVRKHKPGHTASRPFYKQDFDVARTANGRHTRRISSGKWQMIVGRLNKETLYSRNIDVFLWQIWLLVLLKCLFDSLNIQSIIIREHCCSYLGLRAPNSCREFRRFAPSAGQALILVKMEEIRFSLQNVYAVQKPKRNPETEQQPAAYQDMQVDYNLTP
jgi:hypothetical protein